jgi:hypothetical protein
MMCLGWYNRPTCAAREQVEVVPGLSPSEQAQIALGDGTGDTGVNPCPNIMWFWLSAGAIVVGGMLKK